MTNTRRAARILLDSRFQKSCYASAVTLFLAIVVIGSIPGARHDMGRYASGLVLHAGAYAVLGALVFLGTGGGASRRALSAMITIAAMGALDEYVQSFWSYRTAALTDWLVDVASGAAISTVLWNFWHRMTAD